MLTELRKLVTEQRALIDGQAERIGALEKDLAALKQSPAGAPAAPAMEPVPQAAEEAQRQPETPKQAVSAGDFPGSNTNSGNRLGHQVRGPGAHDPRPHARTARDPRTAS